MKQKPLASPTMQQNFQKQRQKYYQDLPKQQQNYSKMSFRQSSRETLEEPGTSTSVITPTGVKSIKDDL